VHQVGDKNKFKLQSIWRSSVYVYGEEGLVAEQWIKETTAVEILKCPVENEG
jgi:hypothetical protein